MRIVVTGAAGFIGSTIADRLRAEGHEVVGVDLLLPVAHAERPSWANDLIVADVRDESRMTELVAGADAVCHQAAMVGLGKDALDTPGYASHNMLGTATVLAAMARARVAAIVQASSMVVYGDGHYVCRTDGPIRPGPRDPADLAAGRFDPLCPRCAGRLTWRSITEDAVTDPRTSYAVSKLAQEQLAAAWAYQADGRAISLRYHNVYGPRMPRDTPYAGVASMFRSALEVGRGPRVFEDGRQLRDFVHVDDVAAANVLALRRLTQDKTSAPRHRAYNIASGDPRPILDLATRLAEAMGGPAPQTVGGGRPGDVRHLVADPGRARTELGFRPAVGFEAGVAAFATAELRAPAGTPG